MNTRNQRQPRTNIQPATAGCLHPSCQAHNAHQTAQHAAGMTHNHAPAGQPLVPVQGRRFRIRINKNWTIGILIFLLVGAMGALNDKDNEIAHLKASHSHSATAPKADSTQRLDYVLKLCKAISAKGDYAQCVTETLAAPQH
jgi:hypothetical protein